MPATHEYKSTQNSSLDPDKSRDLRLLPVIAEQASIMEELLKSKKLEDFNTKDLIRFGLTYNEKSDYQNAKRFFDLALAKLDTDDLSEQEKALLQSQCQYGLANVERELGEDKKSINRFLLARQEILKCDPSAKEYSPLAYDIERNLGIAYLKVKAYAKAAPCFEKSIEIATALKRDGLIPAVTSYYGLALVLSGNPKSGFVQLEKARALYPAETREKSMDWAAHRYHMGRAFQESGDPISAISEFNESLRLRLLIIGPQIGSVYYHSRVGDSHAGLGQCYLALRQDQRARHWLEKALENYNALNNTPKIQETETFIQALPASIPRNTSLKDKYIRYGLGSAALIGLSLFAFRILKGKAAETTDQACINHLGHGNTS